MGMRVGKTTPFSLSGMSKEELDVIRVGLYFVHESATAPGATYAPFAPTEREKVVARRMYEDIVMAHDLVES